MRCERAVGGRPGMCVCACVCERSSCACRLFERGGRVSGIEGGSRYDSPCCLSPCRAAPSCARTGLGWPASNGPHPNGGAHGDITHHHVAPSFSDPGARRSSSDPRRDRTSCKITAYSVPFLPRGGTFLEPFFVIMAAITTRIISVLPTPPSAEHKSSFECPAPPPHATHTPSTMSFAYTDGGPGSRGSRSLRRRAASSFSYQEESSSDE